MSTPALSVLIAAHNPHAGRLQRVLQALAAQTLPATAFEVLLIDNASNRVDLPALLASIEATAGLPLRLLHEPRLGLSHARRCGMLAASAPVLVLVDDDNVLAPDYLEQVVQLASSHPATGCFGGRVLPEFEQTPQSWQLEFQALLALVDHGPEALQFGAQDYASQPRYPLIAPVGAGMVLRRDAAQAWLQIDAARPPCMRLSDRRGNSTASSGDNDIVLCALQRGFDVAYFPQLQLQHLIPASRLQKDALGRLNRGIQHSWQQLLQLHQISPWPQLGRLGARLRCLRAWWTQRTWRGPAQWVRWQGICGHFEGRVHERLP